MEGMPASVSVANSTISAKRLFLAYSVKYTAAPTPSGSEISSVNRMRYSVFRMLGRMPMVPFIMLGEVLSSCQVTCGRPRTRM